MSVRISHKVLPVLAVVAFVAVACSTVPESTGEKATQALSLAERNADSGRVMQIQASEAAAIEVTGVTPYQFDPAAKSVSLIADFEPSSDSDPWYTVSVTAEGSWMSAGRPASDFPDDYPYGAVQPLEAIGDIPTTEDSQPLYRAASLYLWVPNSALADLDREYVSGAVVGDFPTNPPPDQPPSLSPTAK
jgi:hypothetical protein